MCGRIDSTRCFADGSPATNAFLSAFACFLRWLILGLSGRTLGVVSVVWRRRQLQRMSFLVKHGYCKHWLSSDRLVAAGKVDPRVPLISKDCITALIVWGINCFTK